MSDTKRVNNFKFSKLLDDYLKEKLAIEKEIKSKRAEGAKITESDMRRIRNNDDKKVRTLNNHVFRSMANLIHFFEFINKHSSEFGKLDAKTGLRYYKGIFDDDVEELFGFKRPHSKKTVTEDANVVFSRLLNAFLHYRNRNINLQLTEAITDFTLRSIAVIIHEKTVDPDTGMIRSPIGQIASGDLGRTRIWAAYCASDMEINTKEPRRMIGF